MSEENKSKKVEVSAEDGMEKLARMSGPLASLVSAMKTDEEFKKIISEAKQPYGFDVFLRCVPFLAKHKETFETVAAYYNKTEDEIRKEPFSTFVKQITEVMQDTNVVSFTKASI